MEMRDQDGFCAAGVDAGCAGDGFELFELAGAEPVEVGGHPLFFFGLRAFGDDARTL